MHDELTAVAAEHTELAMLIYSSRRANGPDACTMAGGRLTDALFVMYHSERCACKLHMQVIRIVRVKRLTKHRAFDRSYLLPVEPSEVSR